MSVKFQPYYVPDQSPWPLVGALGLFLLAGGAGLWIAELGGIAGPVVFAAGTLVMTVMLFGWFSNVIEESGAGLYSKQLDRSFRLGMSWFIFSEVMFFGAFFGALFYARMLSVPWLGGAGNNAMTNAVLWPDFSASWPLLSTPGGIETTAMGWFGLPLINTLILLTSSVTAHLAHLALLDNKRSRLSQWLGLTVLLGMVFLTLQVWEYVHAYQELGLRLDSGIYGNTFFLLTGFHGAHVTLGTLMLGIMWLRVRKGHFTPAQHFGFQASSWYWHFVDVVWLCLFIFVYIL
ncbi:MFS transporter [Oceanisphaera marina]|uniref:cytochrome-c oxidase n=1 Tax=Oceanisphaera marina TaxID=2017550 RepID=A0ABQ1II48_9GAMM|nr:cytochrome c oxidase subunit 3 [Oceanisphaera marina]GGB41552.1 MFS transporter [Oceanisphaera marina]